MKTRLRQVSHSRSRDGRREAIARANKVKETTKLDDYPPFGRDYGDWKNTVCGFFTYNHLGVEIKLRFSQVSWEWTARAEHLEIEKQFPHQSPKTLKNELNSWISSHINKPPSPEVRLRQSTPSIQGLAARHNIPVSVADEITIERGF